MWVAKIGGSLHAADGFSHWLGGLCADRSRRWLLVPGGGPHADEVRDEQQRLGYDDVEAHARAMLAMARYGDELLGKCAATRLGSLAACIEFARSACPTPGLWCPSREDASAFPALPMDWRVTSDSLAYALALRVQAEGLLLVKSIAPPVDAPAWRLAEEGWVDAWFPQLLDPDALPAFWTSFVGQAEFPQNSSAWHSAIGTISC